MLAVAVAAVSAACAAGLLTVLASEAGLRLFPDFRSREQKSGEYRRDVTTAAAAGSSRLPSVVGPAMLLALTVVVLAAAWVWRAGAPSMLYLLGLCWLETLLGWLDDLRKSRGQGLSERSRLAAHLAIAVLAAVFYAVLGFGRHASVAGQIVAAVIVGVAFLYIVLSAGFSDGVDGLTVSLTGITGLAYVVLGVWWSAEALGLTAGAVAGVALGALVVNAPSNWTRTGMARRRARGYIGDSGALLAGAAVAGLAITSGTLALLPLLAAGFVLEGGSVFLQTGLLVPLFRRGLRPRRFRDSPTLVPHTDFPLPFLATPLHHHLNLAGLQPLQVGATFWLIQGCAAILGLAAAAIAPPLARAGLWVAGVGAVLMVTVVMAGAKPQFLTKDETSGDLRLCRGLPLQLWRLRLYRDAERAPGVQAAGCVVPWLDRPLHRYDCLCLAALAAADQGASDAATRLIRRVPTLNLLLRPEAALLVAQQADQRDELVTVVQTWRSALRQVYQEGRVDLLLSDLSGLADARHEPALADALRGQIRGTSPPDGASTRVCP